MKTPFILATSALISFSAAGSAQADEAHLAQIAEFFSEAQIYSGPDLVECKLSGGAETICFSITVSPTPRNHETGPWCPKHIDDGPEAGGIWFVDGQAVDVDGAFIQSLAELYGDTNWQLFDPDTGEVRYTGSLEACEAAARPNVDPEYQNHCVQCLPEYLPDDISLTYVIPVEPVASEEPAQTNQSGAGLAFNGGRLDGPAPLDAILGAYTIAAFDDCGGHGNPVVGYHYHAVTDCLSENVKSSGPHDAEDIAATGHGTQVGIAMDGHPIFAHAMGDGSDPDGLDACNGHSVEGLGYHYHAGEVGSNAILGCLSAQAGCTLENGDQDCDATRRRRR